MDETIELVDVDGKTVTVSLSDAMRAMGKHIGGAGFSRSVPFESEQYEVMLLVAVAPQRDNRNDYGDDHECG